jgi:multicomponent Na+:H+ antiporter subunit G
VTLVVAAALAAGVFFHGVAAVGVARLPDFFTRLHAVSKAETLGVLLTLAALALVEGATLTTVKLGLVALFLFLANPTATHAIARAAVRSGMRPVPAGPGTRP